jgi:type III secretion protein T
MSEMVGELIDTARGQMISAVMDPLHGHGVSDLATLAKLSSVVVALMCGALEIVVSALVRSVEVLPIGSPAHDASLIHGVLWSGAFLLGEGMRLCAVWVGAFLVIDIVCSILSRVVNGLTFCQAAVILKLLAAFLLLLVFVLQGDQLSQGWLTRVVAPWEWGAVSSPAPVVRDGARGPNAGTEVKK